MRAARSACTSRRKCGRKGVLPAGGGRMELILEHVDATEGASQRREAAGAWGHWRQDASCFGSPAARPVHRKPSGIPAHRWRCCAAIARAWGRCDARASWPRRHAHGSKNRAGHCGSEGHQPRDDGLRAGTACSWLTLFAPTVARQVSRTFLVVESAGRPSAAAVRACVVQRARQHRHGASEAGVSTRRVTVHFSWFGCLGSATGRQRGFLAAGEWYAWNLPMSRPNRGHSCLTIDTPSGSS